WREVFAGGERVDLEARRLVRAVPLNRARTVKRGAGAANRLASGLAGAAGVQTTALEGIDVVDVRRLAGVGIDVEDVLPGSHLQEKVAEFVDVNAGAVVVAHHPGVVATAGIDIQFLPRSG